MAGWCELAVQDQFIYEGDLLVAPVIEVSETHVDGIILSSPVTDCDARDCAVAAALMNASPRAQRPRRCAGPAKTGTRCWSPPEERHCHDPDDDRALRDFLVLGAVRPRRARPAAAIESSSARPRTRRAPMRIDVCRSWTMTSTARFARNRSMRRTLACSVNRHCGAADDAHLVRPGDAT